LRYGYAGKKKKYRRIRIGKRGKLITLRALRYRRAGSRSRVGYIKLRNRTGKSVFVKITYYNRFNRRKVRTYYLSNGRNKAIAAKRGSRFRIRYGTKRYGNKKRRRGKITGKYRYIYLR
jgi:hypothetical protein